MRNLIFSDVDGCLIGKKPTCFTPIINALQTLSPSFLMILATGKTAHEIMQLNSVLQLPGPFIVENGHGLLFKGALPQIPSSFIQATFCDYTLLSLGKTSPEKSAIKPLCPPYSLLTEMENDTLAALTSISEDNAFLAKQRFFTEPIFIANLTPDALKTLKKQLAKKKLYYLQTARFLHIASSPLNKGRAIKILLHSLFSDTINHTSSIGDSLNDFSMFSQCDCNYYIANQPYYDLPKRCEVILETELSGWLNALKQITMKKITRDQK